MTLRLYAEQKAWPLTKVRVEVGHAKLPDTAPADLFTRAIELTGDLSPEQRSRLLEIAGRCPVHRTLETGSRVGVAPAGTPAPIPPESPNAHVRDMQAACDEADGCPSE
jgi:putative redox protein